MNTSFKVVGIIALVLFTLFGVIVLSIFLLPKDSPLATFIPGIRQAEVIDGEMPSSDPIQPSGKIILSLLPKGAERNYPSPYVYDIEAKTLTQSNLDVFDNSFRTYVADVKTSPNGEWAAFKGFKPADVPSDNWQDWTYSVYPQIHRASLSGSTSVSDKLNRLKDEATKVTDVVSDHKQLSSINNAGSIVFTTAATTDGQTEVQPAENFTINHIDSAGTVTELTQGFAPKWVNEDYFIFLKNDGVYSYSVNDNTEKLVYTVKMGPDPVKSNFKFNVSKDGRFFALPLVGLGRTFVVGLQYVPEPVLDGLDMYIEVDGFWPTFSPDGEFLAIQGVDVKNIDNDPKPFLNIWRTSDFSKVDIHVDLDAYQQDYMFIDDWVK